MHNLDAGLQDQKPVFDEIIDCQQDASSGHVACEPARAGLSEADGECK
jgi:hypothetical protein